MSSRQRQNRQGSGWVTAILWVVCILVIVAMVGFFISLTDLFEEEAADRGGSTNKEDEVVDVPGVWQLVDSIDLLNAGDQIIIVATEYDYGLGAVQSTNNRSAVCVTKNGDVASFTEDVQIITLEEGLVSGTFGFKVDDGYLYASSSSSNNLKTKETLDENGSWLISISEEGITNVTAQGDNTHSALMFNYTNNIFSCYALTNTQKTVSVYKLVANDSE